MTSTASSGGRRRSTPARIDHLYQDPHERDAQFHPALRRPDRCHQPDPHRAGNPARRDLQSRRAEPRPGQLRDAGIHRQRRCARHAAPARGDPHSRARKTVRFYQASTSELYGMRPGDPAERDHTVLSALALRRRQALCLLDHGELPRGLRHARLQRHPVQPREPDARRDLRHPQDHARGRGDPARPAGPALSRQSRCQARLGPCARLCRGHVADAAAGRSPTTTCSRPARPSRCASSSSGRSPKSAVSSTGAGDGRRRDGHRRGNRRVLVEVDPRYFRPTEVELLLGDPTKARREARLAAHASSFDELVARDGRRPTSRSCDRDA